MPLIVTGSIGIDTVHTPTDSAENVLGGSCTYFCAAASFFTKVRMVAAAGEDFTNEYKGVFEKFPNVCVDGLEVRRGSKTFRWGGKYLENWNDRETLFTELGVLEEEPPTPPEAYKDSRFVFLANAHPSAQKAMVESFPKRVIAVVDTMNLWIETARPELEALLEEVEGLIINDEEAEMLTGHQNPIIAGRELVEKHGLRFIVIKKGAHGCILVHTEGVAMLPAYPVENVTDPTGAGDCFAGGFMGYLAAAHEKDADIHMDSIQQALAHGTVIASFAIESFSLERLATLTKQEVAHRFEEFADMVKVR